MQFTIKQRVKDPRLKEVFNEFAQLLGPNKPTINQLPDQDGNDRFETFMKDKGSLEPEELLEKITEQFGRPSKSPTSVTMFQDNKDPTDEIVNKPEGPKK